MRIDFSKFLSRETRMRIARFKEMQVDYAKLSDEELLQRAEHCMKNSLGGRLGVAWLPGEPVYDATMVDVIIPELLGRLRKRVAERAAGFEPGQVIWQSQKRENREKGGER